VRYSSTHRVALEDGHSFSSVRQRCVAAIAAAGVPLGVTADDADAEAGAAGATGASSAPAASAPSAASSTTASAWSTARIGSAAQWQEEQSCLSELEFDWIRQWYVQGAAHRDEHGWWGPRIAKLEALWSPTRARAPYRAPWARGLPRRPRSRRRELHTAPTRRDGADARACAGRDLWLACLARRA
jgi:hypothetical protein